MKIEKTKKARVTLKNGEIIKGYCNGKNYNGTQYINEEKSNGEIDWKRSRKISIDEIENVTYGTEEIKSNKNLPKSTSSWMREMERSER